MLCLLGVFALSAIAAPIASAAEGPEWWVEKSLLKGSEGIAEETKVPKAFRIEAHGEKITSFFIECSELKVKKGAITAPSTRTEEGVVFEKCIAVGKTACTVATTMTKPLTAELEGPPGAIKLKFKPKSGTEIGTFHVTGPALTCGAEGFYQADGTMICNYSGVETESKEHPLEFSPSSGSKVEVGGKPSEFTGTDEVHLVSKKLWSARF
jgi:hypothetical protein